MVGAPKGNRNAVGSTTNGAPPKYDLVKEASDLIEWSLKDDSTRLYGFTDNKDYSTTELSDFASRSLVFSKALKKTKDRLSLRREQKANKGELSQYIYSVTNHIYDTEKNDVDDVLFKRRLDRQLAKDKKYLEHEVKIKSQALVHVSADILDKFDATMYQVSSLQSAASIERKSNAKETKS